MFTGMYGYGKEYQPARADLGGRVALITGTAGMIGFAAAKRLAQSGCAIAAWDLCEDSGEAKAREIADATGGNVVFYKVDVTDRQAITDAVARVIADFGKIDVLFCNAGGNWGNRKPVYEFDDELFRRNERVNLTGSVVWLCREVIPHMIRQGKGSIIITSSVCGVTGLRNQCGFVGSKFAVSALTRSMALEYARDNIRVNCIAPGSTPRPEDKLNPLWDTVDFENFEKNFSNPENLLYDIPIPRPAEPDDMAGLVQYFASDDAAYTTGQVVCVDGGWTAGFSGNY